MRLALLATVALAAFTAVAITPTPASACGGCFTPQENPSVVTDHRMILSISPTQTTLYDQIHYQGDPASFAWVLPISGEAQIGLSADVLFGSLDGLTKTTVQAPPRSCPPPPFCGNSFGGAADAAANPSSDGVTVTKEEVVGPYETVQLKATDPAALDAWLAKNNFNVPDDVKPVIAAYVQEKFDFLALKLVPGKGIDSMRPVRVSVKGASATLPLRMVAAGTGAVVGITLWVVGDGRYEPQNFPWFRIKDEQLIWDYTQSRSNYSDLRAAETAKSQGRGWEIESSLGMNQNVLGGYVRSGGRNYGPSTDGAGDYLPIDGPTPMTASDVREADLDTLFLGLDQGLRVTRMRADLAHGALVDDLALTASSDQLQLSNFRRAQDAINVPPCPTYGSCPPDGGPGTDSNGASLEGGGCSVVAEGGTQASDVALSFAGVTFLGLVISRRRRRIS